MDDRRFNCGVASASVLLNDQFIGDMGRKSEGQGKPSVSSTLVLPRASGEGSRDIHDWRKSILR